MAGPNNKSGLRGRYWDAEQTRQKDLQAKLKAAGKKAGVIVTIDMGEVEPQPNSFKHKHFTNGKLKEHKVLKNKPGKPSQSGHAVEVTGLLDDLCDAQIRHYNVWDNEQLDTKALIGALNEVAASGDVAVLNLSIGIDANDPALTDVRDDITAGINACLDAGVFVVAGIGECTPKAPDTPGDPVFPASLAGVDPKTGVISVSAVNDFNRPITDSAGGATFSAPGEGIDVMIDADGYRKQDGSSYATAYVSACIWLALAADPNLVPRTANPANPRAGQVALRTVLGSSIKPKLPATTPIETLQAKQRGSVGTIDFKALATNLGLSP